MSKKIIEIDLEENSQNFIDFYFNQREVNSTLSVLGQNGEPIQFV
jgi:hypothetical protein